MIANSFKKLSFGLVALAATSAAAAANSDPSGVWLDSAGRGAVEIAPCGDGGALCGRVVWVKSADHQKRCGQQILGNLEKGSNGTWGSGWIYSPDRGAKFDVEIKRIGPDQLRVVGWAGLRMFSETHIWKRAAPDIARCGGGEQTAAVDAKSDTVAAASPPAAPSAVPAPVQAPDGASGGADKPAVADSGAEEAKSSKAAEKRASRGDGQGIHPAVDKYFKRSADGTCKIDTPWVKVKFDCKER